METLSDPRPLTVEHDRAEFDCGRISVNAWFRRHAWHAQTDGTARVSVIFDDNAGLVAGYITISAAQIERGWMIKADKRNRPERLPVVLIGQLGVDTRYQRRGVSRYLLQNALRVSVNFSREVGCFAVLVQPLDEELSGFYRLFGFRDLPFDDAGDMIVRIKDLVDSGFG